MNNLINEVTKKYVKKNTPELRPGYVVRVFEKIVDGNRERTQVFEGLVLSVKHGRGVNGSFTVRKIAQGRIGVERTFPLHMPLLEKIEVLRQEKVRRSKLYFIREQINKKTKKRKTQEKNIIFELGLAQGEDNEVEENVENTENVENKQENTEVNEVKESVEKNDDAGNDEKGDNKGEEQEKAENVENGDEAEKKE